MCPRGERRVLRTRTRKTPWSDSGKGFTQVQATVRAGSERDKNKLNKRTDTRRGEPVVARTTGTVIKFARTLLATEQCSSTANWSRLSERGPFRREARMAHTTSNPTDKSSENCLKQVCRFPRMTLCQGTLLAGRTTQYLGEDMTLSWTIQCLGDDGKQETWTIQHVDDDLHTSTTFPYPGTHIRHHSCSMTKKTKTSNIHGRW